MVKIKKQTDSITVISKNKTILKKTSEKKKQKKLKGLVETKMFTSNNDLLQKSLPNKISDKKKLKKKKELMDTENLMNNGLSEQSIPHKLPGKTKKEKIKVSEYLNPEIRKKFNISTTDINNVIKGLITFREENPKLQNQLFEEAAPFILQISCHKVPKGISKICRIPLKHSLYTADNEICLIVSEVKGIKNIEHEKHIEYYEKLLKDKGVKNIKKIMTFHEFRTEYETYEQKLRLVDLYDVFLADGKISGKVVQKCGKIFYKKHKVPAAVKLQASKLKEHFDKILLRTFLNLHLKGNSYTIQFGHTNMQEKQLVENFSSVLEFLDKDFPGGFQNIQGLLIATHRAPSISVYVSTKSANDLEVPKVVVKKPKAFKTFTGELTTIPNGKVVVKPSGQTIVKRKNKKYTKGKQGNDDTSAGKFVRLKPEDKLKSKRKSIKTVE